MPKVRALIKQGLARAAGQRIDKTVCEIQLRRVAAALAKIAIGLTRALGLFVGEGLDSDLGNLYQSIKIAAQDRIAAGINDQSGFQIGGR